MGPLLSDYNIQKESDWPSHSDHNIQKESGCSLLSDHNIQKESDSRLLSDYNIQKESDLLTHSDYNIQKDTNHDLMMQRLEELRTQSLVLSDHIANVNVAFQNNEGIPDASRKQVKFD